MPTLQANVVERYMLIIMSGKTVHMYVLSRIGILSVFLSTT